MAPERRLWSSSGWYVLHLISYFYHPDLHSIYSRFYRKLGIMLPCEKCRKHYREYTRRHPIRPGEDLILWTIHYHNEVNSFTKGGGQEGGQEGGQGLKLDLVDVYDLLHVRDELIINHRYIWIFLKVLHMYYQETDHLPLYREFLRVFREIMPCRTCRFKLIQLKMEIEDIPKYLQIIKRHYVKKEDKIKFKVS